MAKGKVGKTVESLGDYLREQRVSAQLSLRQLAEQAGVSNPYLSQIERGLRRPSAEVLQQIAKALRISAEQLYVRAGIVSPEDGVGGSVELAILGDTALTERQKQSLLDVYASFLALNQGDRDQHLKPLTEGVDMAKAKFDIKTEATRPLYAGVGVTDLAVGFVRDYVADVQKRFAGVQKDVQTRISDLDLEPKALRDQAVTVVSARVDALSKDAKARRAAIEARVAELQADARTLPATVGDTYADLAKRGETLVERIRRQQSTQADGRVGLDHDCEGEDHHDAGQEGHVSTTTTAKKTAKTTAKKTSTTAKKASNAPKSSAKATATVGQEDRVERGRGRHRRRREGRRLKRPGAADAVLTARRARPPDPVRGPRSR